MTEDAAKIEPARTFPADRRAWIVVGLLVVAVVLGMQMAGKRRVVEPPVHGEISERFRLAILAYGRLVDEPDGLNLPASLLAEHLENLRVSGFEPVSLDQVIAAYDGGQGLPPRSVLLTFDGGFLSTWQAADPILRRAGWPAVMFLETSRQEHKDTTYLYWHRLQRMVDSGVWQLGTRGHRDSAGEDGGYALGRSTIEARLDGYRVLAATSLRGLTRPIAEVDPASEGRAFPVGIENDVFGVNGPDSDLRRLVRFPVDLSLSGPRLAERLAAATSPPPLYDDSSSNPLEWVPGNGKVTREGETLLLQGAGGAEIWLAGSNWAEGWELTANILPEAGQFWILSESSEPGRRWLWGGDREGLYLQERGEGMRPRLISRAPRTESPDGWHEIRVVKRGGGLHVEWDGAPIKGSPLRLPWRAAGKVALATASVGDGARLQVADLRFRHVPFLVEPVAADPSPNEIRSAARREDYIAALGPRWIRLANGDPLAEATLNRDLLAMLCRRHGWQLYPSIEVVDPESASDATWRETVVDRASGAGWDGVHLDLSQVRETDRGAAEALREQLSRSLGARGMALTVTEIPTAEDRAAR